MPIGRDGAAASPTLEFGPTDPGWLVVGRPGTASRTCCTPPSLGLTLRYGPDELELHLIGLGTESGPAGFGELGVPHAAVVAIGGGQEFGIGGSSDLGRDRATPGADRGHRRRTSGLPRLPRPPAADRLPRLVAVLVERVGDLFDGTRRKVQRAAELLDSSPGSGRRAACTWSSRRRPTTDGSLARRYPSDDRRPPRRPDPDPGGANLRGVAALDVITLGPDRV